MTPPDSQTTEAVEATSRLLRAGWHPIQVKALTILTERIASPKEIAVELGMTAAKASQVSYHVKELLKHGLVDLVRTEPRRGVAEHFYRAKKPLIVMDPEAERMSMEERLAFSWWIICCISGDFATAVDTRSIDHRTDRHLSRFPLRLDERGYLDLVEEHNRVFHRTVEIEQESEVRLSKSGEMGMSVSAVLGSFPMPRWPREEGDLPARTMTRLDDPPTDAVEATSKMLRAGWHSIQIKALTILTERLASPKEIAVELGMTAAKAGRVSYHVKELLNRGLVELVRTEQRRGASEHFYRAVGPLIVMDPEAERMSFEERFAFSCWIICCMSADFALALETGTIDTRPDRHLSRFPLTLDERGYSELVEEHNRVFHRTVEIADESKIRLVESNDPGTAVSAILACFPVQTMDYP
jgi:predicted transcriptional regulator